MPRCQKTWRRCGGSSLSTPRHRSADESREVVVAVGMVQGLSEGVDSPLRLSELDANLQELAPKNSSVSILPPELVCLPRRLTAEIKEHFVRASRPFTISLRCWRFLSSILLTMRSLWRILVMSFSMVLFTRFSFSKADLSSWDLYPRSCMAFSAITWHSGWSVNRMLDMLTIRPDSSGHLRWSKRANSFKLSTWIEWPLVL